MRFRQLMAPEIGCGHYRNKEGNNGEIYLECPMPRKEKHQCECEYSQCYPSESAVVQNGGMKGGIVGYLEQ